MCGIYGAVGLTGPLADPLAAGRGAAAVRHRGPDDAGYLLANRATGAVALFAGPDSPAVIRETLPPASDAAACAADHAPDVAFGHRRVAIVAPTPAGHQPFLDSDRAALVSGTV